MGDETRACTCHPDDNPPVPCQRKYALSECRKAAAMTDLPTDELAAIVERVKVSEAQVKKWHWDAMEDEQDLFTLARAVTALQAENGRLRDAGSLAVTRLTQWGFNDLALALSTALAPTPDKEKP